MGIKKSGLDEQWITLTGRGAAAADANIDADFAQFDFVIGNVYAEVAAAGVTGSMVVDVNIDGTTIFSSSGKITFTSAATANAYDSLATSSGSKGARFSLDIDSIHSGTAAEGLVVHIQLLKARRGTSGKTATNTDPASL